MKCPTRRRLSFSREFLFDFGLSLFVILLFYSSLRSRGFTFTTCYVSIYNICIYMFVFMLAALWGRHIMGPDLPKPRLSSQGARHVLIAISATVYLLNFLGVVWLIPVY